MEGGMAATERLLSKKTLPTAIMCSNDMAAIDVLHKLYRDNFRVPGDISLIGFDDIHLTEMMIPPLTSVQLSRLDLARAAVSALRAHVEGTAPKREYYIDTRLVVRESTGPPRGTMPALRNAKSRSQNRAHLTDSGVRR
jgi:LacI family transcriptional regulator